MLACSTLRVTDDVVREVRVVPVMGTTILLTMSPVVATDTIEEVRAFGVSVARSELPTGGAGVGGAIQSEVTNLFAFEASF